ncbi:MAG: carbohydrate binding domain-containing protein [Rikenellaceae bacterium]|jgi:hypothetical protein|nr:carbohydrate binding domain-containing protein [Rikenellaceae bacterium]
MKAKTYDSNRLMANAGKIAVVSAFALMTACVGKEPPVEPVEKEKPVVVEEGNVITITNPKSPSEILYQLFKSGKTVVLDLTKPLPLRNKEDFEALAALKNALDAMKQTRAGMYADVEIKGELSFYQAPDPTTGKVDEGLWTEENIGTLTELAAVADVPVELLSENPVTHEPLTVPEETADALTASGIIPPADVEKIKVTPAPVPPMPIGAIVQMTAEMADRWVETQAELVANNPGKTIIVRGANKYPMKLTGTTCMTDWSCPSVCDLTKNIQFDKTPLISEVELSYGSFNIDTLDRCGNFLLANWKNNGRTAKMFRDYEYSQAKNSFVCQINNYIIGNLPINKLFDTYYYDQMIQANAGIRAPALNAADLPVLPDMSVTVLWPTSGYYDYDENGNEVYLPGPREESFVENLFPTNKEAILGIPDDMAQKEFDVRDGFVVNLDKLEKWRAEHNIPGIWWSFLNFVYSVNIPGLNYTLIESDLVSLSDIITPSDTNKFFEEYKKAIEKFEKGGENPGPNYDLSGVQDFETDDASNWQTQDAPANGVTVTVGYTADGGGYQGKGRALTITNNIVGPNAWDAQFFFKIPEATMGKTYKFSMDVKSDAPANIQTQNHADPGSYLYWDAVGQINTTTQWQHYEWTGTTTQSDFRTIAFLFGKVATTYYFDNLKWEEVVW